MVDILKKWGYSVGDVTGRQNFEANMADMVLFSLYFLFSTINLIGSSPSVIVIFLNIVSIVRMVIKNYIEQSKIVAQSQTEKNYISEKITLVHFTKIIVEMLILLITLICWLLSNGMGTIALFFVFLNILLTEIENLLSMIERLYDAKPLPLMNAE